MPHSSTTIWIYANWTTWNKLPLITHHNNDKIHQYIFQEFISCGCTVRIIHGPPDSVHCLFQLNSKKSLDETIKMVKGASSHHINQENLTTEKFAWQKGYNAVSVSESQLEKLIRNIKIIKQSQSC